MKHKSMTECHILRYKFKIKVTCFISWRLCVVDCIVKEKVGQGKPLTKGYNNAICFRNCYNLDSFRIKIILKAYEEQ